MVSAMSRGKTSGTNPGGGGSGGGNPPPPGTTPPPPTRSLYMKSVNSTVSYNLGCLFGYEQENGIVILDFGQPTLISANPPVYGATLFDPSLTEVTTDQI
jgi:hypothetical protein